MTQIYTTGEVCALLHIRQTTLKGLVQNGKISFFRINSDIRFTESDIEEFVKINHITALREPLAKKKVKDYSYRSAKSDYKPGDKVV